MNQDQITRIEKIKAVLDAATKEGAVIQATGFGGNVDGWVAVKDSAWNFDDCDYRVLLPSQPTKQSVTARDWDGQPVVWVRLNEPSDQIMVRGVNSSSYSVEVGVWYKFSSPNHGEYSFTRKKDDWHPFTKEVPGEMVVVASTE